MIKHPQHILAFDKSQFGIVGTTSNFVRMSAKEFFNAAYASLFIGRRHELETDERFGQVLPYIVLWRRTPSGPQVFVYQRGKGVGESRLKGKMSVGVGGHVDLGDIAHNDNVIDVVMTLARATNRELSEEIEFHLFSGDDPAVSWEKYRELRKAAFPRFVGIINDQSDAVGRVHYGVVFALELPTELHPHCREEELDTIGWLDPHTAMGAGEGAFENWSNIILQNWELIVGEVAHHPV